jgi:hypothetical protein
VFLDEKEKCGILPPKHTSNGDYLPINAGTVAWELALPRRSYLGVVLLPDLYCFYGQEDSMVIPWLLLLFASSISQRVVSPESNQTKLLVLFPGLSSRNWRFWSLWFVGFYGHQSGFVRFYSEGTVD